jgi:hypothetical protein
MTRREKFLTSAVLLTCLAACIGVGWRIFDAMRPKPEPRREIAHLMSRVQINDSKTQVRKNITSFGYKHLQLWRDDPLLWSIITPGEAGANWNLLIEFDKNDKVAALYLRTSDSGAHRPREAAPSDKVRPGWQTAFPRLLLKE